MIKVHYKDQFMHYFKNEEAFILWFFIRNWNATFGVYHAKGCYVDVIIFGRVIRVWATPEFR